MEGIFVIRGDIDFFYTLKGDIDTIDSLGETLTQLIVYERH
jgi:hypothetical protein